MAHMIPAGSPYHVCMLPGKCRACVRIWHGGDTRYLPELSVDVCIQKVAFVPGSLPSVFLGL